MIRVDDFIDLFSASFPSLQGLQPWNITQNLSAIISELINGLDLNYRVDNGIAIHSTATIEEGSVLKPPLIVGANCFIGAHAYLRGGVFLSNHVKIGTGCEIKSSIIFPNSSIAHFNFIGDSIIGAHVNFEAGSITANHFNEKIDKTISVFYRNHIIKTGSEKFGSLVGDRSKIGANAVLSPGTILEPDSVVKRLELIDQQQ
jgi:NDP-sugar pyrophosphorylase family protein